MRLLSRTAFLAAIVSVVACSEASAPEPPVNFQLLRVNGNALPATYPPPDGPTVLSGSLFLFADGRAIVNERRRQLDGSELVLTLDYTYVITDNQIQFEDPRPCPPDAICAGPPKGTFSGSHLFVDYTGGYQGLVYEYSQWLPD